MISSRMLAKLGRSRLDLWMLVRQRSDLVDFAADEPGGRTAPLEEHAEAADMPVPPVRETVAAKRAGGAWTQAELIPLPRSEPGSSTGLPDGALAS